MIATERAEALAEAWEHFSVKHGITGTFQDAGWEFAMGFVYGHSVMDERVAVMQTRLADSRSHHRKKYKRLRARTRKTIAGLTAALSRRKEARQRSYARIKELEAALGRAGGYVVRPCGCPEYFPNPDAALAEQETAGG